MEVLIIYIFNVVGPLHLKMESKKDLRKISPLKPEGLLSFMQYLEGIKNVTVVLGGYTLMENFLTLSVGCDNYARNI